ncbi:MAG: hypothetical protein HYY25_08710 [Candidatus Wallbacteria bacterium]|nr:hypothetical protein [Candidatus Wallbacteria bacterium]
MTMRFAKLLGICGMLVFSVGSTGCVKLPGANTAGNAAKNAASALRVGQSNPAANVAGRVRNAIAAPTQAGVRTPLKGTPRQATESASAADRPASTTANGFQSRAAKIEDDKLVDSYMLGREAGQRSASTDGAANLTGGDKVAASDTRTDWSAFNQPSEVQGETAPEYQVKQSDLTTGE